MNPLEIYSLPRSSKKIKCPKCGHKASFKPYVLTATGTVVDEYQYGRCERQNECGYNMFPPIAKQNNKVTVMQIYPKVIKQDGFDDGYESFNKDGGKVIKRPVRGLSPLHKYLKTKGIPPEFLWDNGVMEENGYTVYVMRDKTGKVANLKYFKYKDDGHRDKNQESFSLKSPPQRNEYIEERFFIPLFGEHETDPAKTVCIVESEKSKIIAMFHYPEFIWQACSSANGMSDGTEDTADKITPLKGRRVYWVCDNDKAARGVFKEDHNKKQIFVECSSVRNLKKHIKDFHICDLFTDKEPGYDIGDALLDGLKVEIKPTWSTHQADKRYASYFAPDMERMKKEYDGAIQIGETSGINPEFDNTFSWMRTHVNGFYGWSNDGKGVILEYLSIMKAKISGWKTCMFKQEDMGSHFDGKNSKMNADRIYAKLAWTLTGVTPFEHYSKKHNTELLAWDKFMEAQEWLRKFLFIVYPSDRRYSNVFDEFLYFYEVFGIDHFAIDPWNTIILDDKERGDERLISAFIHAKEFVLKTNSVLSIVNHAKSIQEVKETTGENKGMFKVVNQFMQLGGSAWDIKMDGQYSIHRPNRHKHPNHPEVHFWNLKQRDSEIVGAERGRYGKIFFNRDKRQYYFDGKNPIDGSTMVMPKSSDDGGKMNYAIQQPLAYQPTWHQDKKNKNKSYEEHIAKDWAQSSRQDEDLPPWVTD